MALLGLTGCRSEHLALRADDRLAFEAPHEMQRVAAPVWLRWRADGVRERRDLTGPGPFFAVFVDRAPIPAGTGLAKLFEDECEDRTDCPDQDLLAEHRVYVTGRKQLTLTVVPDLGGTRTGADDTHRITVVLIGQDGVRLDERSASVEFEVVNKAFEL